MTCYHSNKLDLTTVRETPVIKVVVWLLSFLTVWISDNVNMLLLFLQFKLKMVVDAACKKENIRTTFDTFLRRVTFLLMFFSRVTFPFKCGKAISWWYRKLRSKKKFTPQGNTDFSKLGATRNSICSRKKVIWRLGGRRVNIVCKGIPTPLPFLRHPPLYPQSVTKYLRLTLVFMWNSVPREEFNCNFSGLGKTSKSLKILWNWLSGKFSFAFYVFINNYYCQEQSYLGYNFLLSF